MAQFTLKIKTYDPDIVNAFARLRKSRKQSAFTHEALKYFLATEQGAQVMALMSKEMQPECTKPKKIMEQPRQMPPVKSEPLERQSFPLGNSEEDYCAAVLGNILK